MSARLVLAGFHGTTAEAPDVKRLLELGVGGFVLFGRNVEHPAQVQALLTTLIARSGHPLLLAVDQEGGRVARLKAPLTVWPPMARLGEANDPELAREVGRGLGRELAAVGFNLDLAPVLDVRFEGTTIAIGDRALSDDPAVVAALGVQLALGLQDAGLAACAKHFPGHGHVTVDSHVELPVCPLDEASLRREHLAPFAAAIAAGVDCVMSAHVVYPAFDDAPATLSTAWMTDVLRKELGFSGVVLTDDLEMGAIVRHGGLGAAAVRSIRAGADGLLVCSRVDGVAECAEAVAAECRRDRAFAARCAQAEARLDVLARRRPARPDPDLDGQLGRPEHLALAERLGTAAAGTDPTRAHLA